MRIVGALYADIVMNGRIDNDLGKSSMRDIRAMPDRF